MTVANEFEKANKNYAASFTKGDLALPPARKVVVIVCMDARIDPAAALGLQEGDAHVLLLPILKREIDAVDRLSVMREAVHLKRFVL